jgi:hypothetical protein
VQALDKIVVRQSYSVIVLLFWSLNFSAQSSFDASQVSAKGLSVTQARELLTIVIHYLGYDNKKKGMSIDESKTGDGNPPHPGYFDFALNYDSPKLGATQVLGVFSVSRLTGDVWETNLCKRYNFPELQKAQAAIMRRTAKSFADEAKARSGLGCSDE